MSTLSLIIQREYATRVRKKSFLLLTILMPFIIVGMIGGTLFLSQIKDTEVKKILVIDDTRKYAQHFQNFDNYVFETTHNNPDNAKQQIGGEIFGFLQINTDLVNNPQAVTFLSEKQIPLDLERYLRLTLGEVIKHEKLNIFSSESDIDPNAIAAIRNITESPNPVKINTVRLDADGLEKETSTGLATGLAWVTTLLMYMFIFSYGTMVMQGVIEEKSNRIVEVMISSVKPFDLMMGKIIGICLVGLTQLVIWIVMSLVLMYAATNAFVPEMNTGELSTYISMLPSVNWLQIVIFFFLFFLGGYLMYAALFAMFGSAVDNPQDSQQFVMPLTLVFIFALYAGIYSVSNPDGPLAFWCSMIPLTSPVVMMVRIPFGVPLWEVFVSFAILAVTALAVVKLAAKVYRVGILMYGKKPSLTELYKWVKYK
ncbi:ABC transporter permease [Dysgonomonas sp. 520]|uniref:ABC transporter permease n=1 Tax=Dysgonomonas sp. 520 TaxID=2302931 RepID=UPI0013D2A994|nr:ABC transporter permease [Dysgonomonas sp. 520]NDW11025.1 ABC transporter permease [Dysgonomonas sp. 520]